MNKYYAGGARTDITPPLGVPYLSFKPRHEAFRGVHDPLFATAAVISDGDHTVAIVSADGIGFNNDLLGANIHFTTYVRKLISSRCPIKNENILIASSHIHSTPDTIFSRMINKDDFPCMQSWFKIIAEKIADIVALAQSSMKEASLSCRNSVIDGVSVNRRGGAAIDNSLTTLMFSLEDARKIIISHFACHPVIVQAQPYCSADFPGVMRTTVEKAMPESVFLFLQGCCGDINPIMGDTGSFDDVRAIGLALGGEIISQAGLLEISKCKNEPAVVDCVSKSIVLRSKELPKGEDAAKFKDNADAMLRLSEGEPDYLSEIQIIRLGNSLILCIEGEPFCEMGVALKHRLEKDYVCLPTGYANGYLGYICPPAAFEQGGYEPGTKGSLGPWSIVGPGAFSEIINGLCDLAKKINVN